MKDHPEAKNKTITIDVVNILASREFSRMPDVVAERVNRFQLFDSYRFSLKALSSEGD